MKAKTFGPTERERRGRRPLTSLLSTGAILSPPLSGLFGFPLSFISPAAGGDSIVVYFLLFLLLLCPDILRMFVGQGERRKGKGADRRIRGTISPRWTVYLHLISLISKAQRKRLGQREGRPPSDPCVLLCVGSGKLISFPFPGGKWRRRRGFSITTSGMTTLEDNATMAHWAWVGLVVITEIHHSRPIPALVYYNTCLSLHICMGCRRPSVRWPPSSLSLSFSLPTLLGTSLLSPQDRIWCREAKRKDIGRVWHVSLRQTRCCQFVSPSSSPLPVVVVDVLLH